MSKITFRADDDLVEAVESLDASKSEVMRDALRTYLEGTREPEQVGHRHVEESLDELIDRRVNDVLEDRIDGTGVAEGDVAITLSVDRVETERTESSRASESAGETSPGASEDPTCRSCGTTLDPSHEFCPSCGERAPTETYCECGTSLEDGWAFCPSCGRRTPAADALDR
ncbi:MAG: zinc ribbon domain-containing protein [Halanaeroarchaeum sp.]